MINADAHVDLRRLAQQVLTNRTGEPVSIVDIGSNSIRLVVYEGGSSVPNVVFNEKVQAALGADVAAHGHISDAAFERANKALTRFAAMAKQAGSSSTHALATAAVREAKNGPDFTAMAQERLGCKIKVLSGVEEAQYAAFGIVLGFDKPDGIVGDMGGGSLEIVRLKHGQMFGEVTAPLGGLRLAYDAGGDPLKASHIVRGHLANIDVLNESDGCDFFAIGGTWRNLASMHMAQKNHPLRIIHDYTIEASEAIDYCKQLMHEPIEAFAGFEQVSLNRRELIPLGAAVLSETLIAMRASRVRFSAFGVREGYLHNRGKVAKRTHNHAPLLDGVLQFAHHRSRSSQYALELCDWSDRVFDALHMDESEEEQHLRWAGCMLADTSWRAHPDYRGSQSLNILSHGQFVGIGHKGRAFLALAAYYRNEGTMEGEVSSSLVRLAEARLAHRAQILGGLLRLGYALSASMPGVLGDIEVSTGEGDSLLLRVPKEFSDFLGERPARRAKQFGNILQRDVQLELAN